MSTLSGSGRVASLEQRVKIPKLDWPLLVAGALLILVGFLSLYSEGFGKDGDVNFRKQVINVVIGLGPFCFFWLVHPKLIQRLAIPLYWLNIAILLFVLKFGHQEMGAQRWISLGPVQFQPSELAKLILVFTLASFLAKREDSMGRFDTFAYSFLHVALPAALIFKQPHLGATLVVIVIWLSILIIAEAPLQYVCGFIAVTAILSVFVWNAPGVLSAYQRDRIVGLLNSSDKDKGYQALRSQIAFGEGGVYGEGYLKGEQKQARFIPEQRNDFIFTVVGEEGGLVGSTLVLCLYGFFFYRAWLVMVDATEPYYKMLVAGIIGLLGFHMVVNLGMILQLLPVVGLWLPFLSYGGTAMWLCMSCLGLLLNIRRQERPVLFS